MGYYEPDEGYYEPHELEIILDEYKGKCKTVLLSEIDQEIKNLRKENNNYKEQNEKLLEKVRCLDKLKLEFEKHKNKVIQEGVEEYQRNALCGLRCGDTIWTIKTESMTEKCPHCKGTHKILVNVAGVNKEVECPHCHYNGFVITDKQFIPIQRIVSQIQTTIWNKNMTFKRYIYCKKVNGTSDTCSDEFIYDNEYGENKNACEHNEYVTNPKIVRRDFYLSEEECQNACKDAYDEWLNDNKRL